VSAYHFFLVVAAMTALVAAALDFRTGHIPNGITVGALLLGPLAHAAVGAATRHSAVGGVQGLVASLVGAACCAVLPLAMYRSAGLGGGDVKLFAAMGALLGTMVGLHAETYAFVFGMVWAIVVVARSGKLASTLGNVAALVRAPINRPADERRVAKEKMTSIRFGPAIFLGTVFAAFMCWGSA
jgi:prepilin peptidase CpaA